MSNDNTHGGAEPSPASAGSHGIPLVVPALTLAGNFAGIKWNSCCRQHRAALNAAGIKWVEDMGPLEDAPDTQPALTDEERRAVDFFAAVTGPQYLAVTNRHAAVLRGLLERTK